MIIACSLLGYCGLVTSVTYQESPCILYVGQLPRIQLLGRWVNKLLQDASGFVVWHPLSVLVAEDTWKEKAVRRDSPNTPLSCGGGLADRVRRSPGWLCRGALGSLAGGTGTH